MFDTFTVFWFCLLSAVLGIIIYRALKKDKTAEESILPKLDGDEQKKDYLDAIKETNGKLISLFLPNDTDSVKFQEMLLDKDKLLVCGENRTVYFRDGYANTIRLHFSREFLGVWRIYVTVHLFDWHVQLQSMVKKEVEFQEYLERDISRYLESISVPHNGLNFAWVNWIKEQLTTGLGYTLLHSAWDVFEEREISNHEIVFCDPNNPINQFLAEGNPAEVYRQTLSFTNTILSQLEKEYITSTAFFSRKISDYISASLLKNITVTELKGKSIINLDGGQHYVKDAVLELDKNDFILKLKLKKPEVELDGDKLLIYVKENLLHFFSDYGKPVEIIEEETDYELQIWNGCIKGDNPGYLATEGHFYFVLRVKEIDGDLHS